MEIHDKSKLFVVFVTFLVLFANISSGENDWCQDYESRRCGLWKAKGLCRSPLPRVKTMMRKLCYETCNFCVPPSPEVCYVNDVRGHRVSEHGCCWDGIIPATGPGGQGCPACENSKSRNFCLLMKDMCFTRENHKLLRISCPETCGYCEKAPHPCRDDSGEETVCQNECYDLDPQELCERRQYTGYCKVAGWQNYLKKRCARTCGFCGKAIDMYCISTLKGNLPLSSIPLF